MNVSGIGIRPAYKNNNIAFKTNLEGLLKAADSEKLYSGEKTVLIELYLFFQKLEKEAGQFFEYNLTGKNNIPSQIAKIGIGKLTLTDLDKYWTKLNKGNVIKEILLKAGLTEEDASVIQIGKKELVA